MTINHFLLKYRDPDNDSWLAPRVKCVDGFSMSVQVHHRAYCSPRDGYGPDWVSAEIGFPSSRPNHEVMQYAENKACPTDTIYGYVPIAAIDRLIAEHGGIEGST